MLTVLLAVLFARFASAPLPGVAQGTSVPWRVGEQLVYGGSYRVVVPISIGKISTLSVAGIDTIGGMPAWKFSLITDISVPLYHNHSELLSWTGVNDFVSRRFVDRVHESHYDRDDDFAIRADSGFYTNHGDTNRHATPSKPLDDLAFIYFLRLPSTPLQPGKTYKLPRYFRDDRNPVLINVLDREPCKLPGGNQTMCLVIWPVVEDPPHGMFMSGKNARIWMTDDSLRLPVQIQSGSYTLLLRQVILPQRAP
ncbi:MAG TPA: DUF3108 domain-containing protein [Gemmatimonadales bacterium]